MRRSGGSRKITSAHRGGVSQLDYWCSEVFHLAVNHPAPHTAVQIGPHHLPVSVETFPNHSRIAHALCTDKYATLLPPARPRYFSFHVNRLWC